MARLNGILSNLSGTIGDLTFSRQGGVTVAKQKPGKRTGKCTDAQMRHKAKWAQRLMSESRDKLVCLCRGKPDVLKKTSNE